jgi:hypothetical protein
LPDVIFSYQKYQFGLENVGIFYGHLVNFVVFWFIISRFGTLYEEKSGSPGKTRPSFKGAHQRELKKRFLCLK